MAGDVLFFGYYTRGTPYEGEFLALEYYLKAQGLLYEYKAVDTRGSWQKNTQMKQEIVLDFINRYPGRRLCYLDVDSVVMAKPVLLEQIQTDIAAVMFRGRELLSGVVLFNATANTKRTVENWGELNRRYPDKLPDGRDAWDQRTLHWAIRMSAPVTFSELPVAYNYIADLAAPHYPGVQPIILATRGALRFKAQIDATVLP